MLSVLYNLKFKKKLYFKTYEAINNWSIDVALKIYFIVFFSAVSKPIQGTSGTILWSIWILFSHLWSVYHRTLTFIIQYIIRLQY